ncbi:hypothetical protein H310_03266 [Aphanomyces invadans]|uniref:Kinesin-like protein n=1 Tax=Aphanomyces invadans TaxID=157072 RepID=A0A024UGV1_9STRA|nr:hypothetical protein H310_03266 [Aphanomyces invadans]ETW05509.1 hypothetical protein H310_03266 [Aphanomyces invadans]|eukprot:XP_008865286.1 hypothetical protein H310_03266 [Aphanomyces invadans]
MTDHGACDGIPQPECVRVVVRMRPSNERERKLQAANESVVAIRPPSEPTDLPTRLDVKCPDHSIDATYNYDAIFGTHANQRDVYAYLQSSVEQVVQGFNCTIFAYGQTGTGKTHTMMGPDSSLRQGDMSQWGIIPRAVDGLFQELKAVGACGAGAFVHCSYMQIYNNQVFDLLHSSAVKDQPPLQVREMIKGHAKHIYVSGISEFRVGNAHEVLDLLHLGSKNRTIRATECNEKSSRSHALLQLSMEVESRGNERTTIIRRAKLNLVDLAGSEKWDTDVAMTHDRTRELRNINASLSALGNVISALTDKKRSHIPYRDSKLTRLLQDSLGGNTRTIVIATISPSVAAVEETVSTLQFAERAKQIALNVQVNEVVDDAVLLARAQREIQKLKLQLQAEQPNVSAMGHKIQALEKQVDVLRVENQQLKAQLALAAPNSDGHPRTAPAIALSADLDLGDGKAQRLAGASLSAQGQRAMASRPASKRTLTTPRTPERTNQDESGVAPDWEHQTQPFLAHLEDIQRERRDLEAQLEKLKFTHVPEEDDVCPMCHLVIDHHTDSELDRCIDLEMQVTATHSSSCKDVAAAPGDDPSRPHPGHIPVKPPSLPSIVARPVQATAAPLGSFPASHDPRETSSSRGSTRAHSLVPVMPAKPKPKPKRSQQKAKLVLAKSKLTKSPYGVKAPLDKPDDSANEPEASAGVGSGLHNDVRDIGVNISVYTYRYDCWYPCTIVGYDSKRKMHCCLYDYGDKQWAVLRGKKFKVLGRDSAPSPSREPSTSSSPRSRNQPF